jgi:hypothetical protein
VVVEIDAFCLPAAVVPPEDQSPLIIDTDRMEARQIGAELSRSDCLAEPQILIGSRIVNYLEPAKVDDHAIAIIALYIHGSERARNHRMEAATPDLDLIKQAEQGRGTGADGCQERLR